MPEGEPRETGLGQEEQVIHFELPGRIKLESAKLRVLDLRRLEKEIAEQLPGAYQEYQEELCSFLGIDPEKRLAKQAEEILDYAEKGDLDPRTFASRLVATIENAQRVIDKNGGSMPAYGTAEESYLLAVKVMRKEARPSMPSGPVRQYLIEAVALSGKEEVENPTMLNRCQHAVYCWITSESYGSESSWWVIVGEPKQVS